MSRRRPRVCSRLTAPRAKSRCVHDRTLRVEQLEQRHLLSVSSLLPEANSHDAATVNDQTVVVHAGQTGRLLSSAGDIAGLTASGAQVTLDPSADFHAGELVEVTITDGLEENGGGTPAGGPYVWQFRTATSGGPAVFKDSGQMLASAYSQNVALGDLDSDGDLDAFMANYGRFDHVWLNDGSGTFSDTGQPLAVTSSFGVALGDLDGDGDLDAYVAVNGADHVWRNDGTGTFMENGQTLESTASRSVYLGDLDGDGDLDAFVTINAGANRVLMNDGSGTFTDSGQMLGSSDSYSVSLGDLDDDGDLDAFVANYNGQSDRVWLNDGSGTFTDSGQTLGSFNGRDVSLGDLDGDGDLDAFVANYNEPDHVWLNDGVGTFSDSGQMLGSENGLAVSLGDLDGDGDLDAFVANYGEASRVWLNNGSATFTDNGQMVGSSDSTSVSLGDLDGDGDLDAYVANYNGQGDRVWLNEESEQQVLEGDYSGNGTIDAADYTAWRDAKTYGATTLLNDHTPGTVDESDFLYWRAHFGETVGSGSGAAVSDATAGAESEPAAEEVTEAAVAEESGPAVAASATTVRATSVLSPAVQADGFAALANDLSATRTARRARPTLAHRLRFHAAVGESELLLLATAKAARESAPGHHRFRLAEADDQPGPCDQEVPADPLAEVAIDWE